MKTLRMKTFITGASGFVGSAVLRQLIEAGHTVVALLRPNSDRSNLAGLPVEIVTGDLTDPDSFAPTLANCDNLFHVAADYRLWVPRPDDMYETNVTATRNLMLAAARARVKRVVYTSSVATLGLNSDGTPADEATPARARVKRVVYTSSVATLGLNSDGTPADEATPVTLADMIGHYKRSKFLAEAEVQRLAEEENLPVVIVNPSTPVGPRDIKPTPTGRMIVEAASGRMPAYVDTGLNLVHVDDVAVGHLLAFDRGTIGRRYILGGKNLTLKEIFIQIAASTDRPAPRVRLPHNLILPIAYVAEGWARLVGGSEPRVTVDEKAHVLFYRQSKT
jgi:dihydroflavonol-4-reductase